VTLSFRFASMTSILIIIAIIPPHTVKSFSDLRSTAFWRRFWKTAAAVAATQEPLPNAHASLDEAIADLAHRLYLERGGTHGHDVEDWLEAERRLRNGN